MSNAELTTLAGLLAETIEALRALQGHYPRTDFALSELQSKADDFRKLLAAKYTGVIERTGTYEAMSSVCPVPTVPSRPSTLGLPKGKVRT